MNKDKYIKPQIGFESLSLGSELYPSCAISVTFSEFVCPIPIPDWGNQTIFQEYNCDWSNGEEFVCYHVPMESMNIFSS